MARPGNKKLTGIEGGKACQHWYEYVKSRRGILRSRIWDGGCPSSKPGTKWFVWLGFSEQGKELWGSV